MKTIYFQLNKIFKITIIAAAISLSACSDNTTEVNTNPEMYIQQGKSYLEMNQFKAAYSSTSEAIKAAPDNVDAYLLLSAIHEKSGQPMQRVSILEGFTGEKNAEYYFSLIDAYQKAGKLVSSAKTIEEQQKILSSQPQRMQFLAAQQFLYDNQLSQAKQAYTELLNDEQYKLDSMLALAKIEAASGNASNAIKIIDEIIEIDASNTESLYFKSLIYISLGELNNAENALSLALTTIPSADIFTTQKLQIIENLIDVLTKQGRSAEAMIYSRILAEEFPQAESLTLQYDKALELFESQNYLAAKEILLDIQDSNPGHMKSATLLGLILYNEGDSVNAEKYLAGVVDPETSTSQLTQLYAATQLQQNKPKNVLSLLESVPEAKRNADIWIIYANAALQQKEYAKAEKALEEASILAPTSPRIVILKSYYYNTLPEPRPRHALQILEAGLSKTPENTTLQAIYIKQMLVLNENNQADEYVKNLADSYTDNNDIQLVVASYYTLMNKLNAAELIVNKILSEEENNLAAMYKIAQINKIKKNWTEVLVNFNSVISLYPNEAIAYVGVVESLIGMNKDPLTAADYLVKNYQPSLLALTLANLTLQQNKLELASSYSIKAAEGLPYNYQESLSSLTLRLNIAKALASMSESDYQKARQLVIASLEKNPENTRLLGLLTRIEIDSKQYTEAKKITDQIAALFPNDSLSVRLESDIYLAQNEFKQAMDLLMADWEQSKDELVAEKLYRLIKEHEPSKALEFLDNWSDYSNSLIALRFKALYFQEKAEYKDALSMYNKVLKQAPNDVISLNNAAWLYFEQGDSRSKGLAERAYKLLPNNAAVLDTYGWILYNNGDKSRGKELIEEAIKLLPNEKTIQQHLAVINEG